jgi:hypothetical protein
MHNTAFCGLVFGAFERRQGMSAFIFANTFLGEDVFDPATVAYGLHFAQMSG